MGRLDGLEGELLISGTTAQGRSPDRMHALVWAVWALMLDGAAEGQLQLRRLQRPVRKALRPI